MREPQKILIRALCLHEVFRRLKVPAERIYIEVYAGKLLVTLKETREEQERGVSFSVGNWYDSMDALTAQWKDAVVWWAQSDDATLKGHYKQFIGSYDMVKCTLHAAVYAVTPQPISAGPVRTGDA